MGAWSILLTIVFGLFNVVQWIQQYLGFRARCARAQQTEAIKASLVQFNAMCNDAEVKGDAEKPAAMKRFISDAAHAAKMIEHQADIILGNLESVPARPPSPLGRVIGYVFPLTRVSG